MLIMIEVRSIALLLILPLVFSLDKCGTPCPDYYWRDFNGIIPQDAFVAAGAAEGVCNKLYVGQTYFKQWELLPAEIDSVSKVAKTTAYSHFLKTSEYVKILCSPNNDIFKWLPIQSSELHLYENRAIPGGSEVGQHLFIGRVKYNGQYFLGKIFKHDRPNKGIWIHKDGEASHRNFLTYDLLTFDCDILRKEGINRTEHGGCTLFDIEAQ